MGTSGRACGGSKGGRRAAAIVAAASLLAALVGTAPTSAGPVVASNPIPGLTGLTATFYTTAVTPLVVPTATACATASPPRLDFNWRDQFPGSCGGDFVRMYASGTIVAPTTGTVEFCAISDDGMIVRIGDPASALTIGDWGIGHWQHACTAPAQVSDIGSIEMTAGQSYPISVWYEDGMYGAGMHLAWRWGGRDWAVVPAGTAPAAAHPRRGLHDLDLRFYSGWNALTPGTAPTGMSTCGAAEPVALDFTWGGNFPGTCGPNWVSMYATATLVAPVTGTVEFCVISDDGMIVDIGEGPDQVTVGDWDYWGHPLHSCEDPPNGNDVGSMEMTAGQSYPIEAWYREGDYGAGLRLSWRWGGGIWETIPGFAPTTTTLATSAGSASVGDVMTITATVVGAWQAPAGTVTFSDGSAALACTGASDGTIDGSGHATCTVRFATAGSHDVSARFPGDADYEPSDADPVTIEIGKARSTVTVTCPASVTYTGSAQTPCTALATGPLDFSQGVSVTHSANTAVGTATASATYAGTADREASSGSATFAILPASVAVLYTGTSIATLPTNSDTATVTLAASVMPAVAGCAIGFSVTDGVAPARTFDATTNGSGTATVSSGTAFGVGTYAVTVTVGGVCTGTPDGTGAFGVGSAGNAAYGGGWYTQGGRTNLAFTVAARPRTSPTVYVGSLVWGYKSAWRFRGTISSYVKSSTTNGIASGSGMLHWWDPTLGGTGGWVVAGTAVRVTIQFQATTSTSRLSSPGAFSISLGYTPTGSQPALPGTSLQTLKGGWIKLN